MTDPLFDVSDQVVLITGGTRGIGRAIAAGFAARGAIVCICSRDRKTVEAATQEISQTGGKVSGLVCDVSCNDQVQQTVATVLSEHGRIDTLINVAGVNRRKPAADVLPDDYEFIMNINLKGAFQMAQSVGRHMIDRRSGNIINVDSLNTHMPLKGVLPYAMSKFGLQGMTRGLALEWGPYNIRVNGLAPGFILTDMTARLWSQPHMQQWNAQNAPLGRLGVPDDMVGTAVFLASQASAFMTGQTLYVDGGFSAGWNWPIRFEDA